MENISVKVGDLFESKAQTLVNTVNCVGVMGKGIALGFKKRYPDMFEDYASRCEAGQLKLGRPYIYSQTVRPWILNFPTKDHWRSASKINDIISGLEYLKAHYNEWGIESLAVPPLGCGNGQLDWDVVGPTLFRYLNQLDIPVEMYAPPKTSSNQLTLDFLRGDVPRQNRLPKTHESIRVDPSVVAFVGVVSRIKRERYHWPVGRIMFQKIAYFVTETGIPTGLEYRRGSYGPFAPDLKRVTTKLVNNGLVTETNRGHMFLIDPGPTYPDAREHYKDQLREWTPAIEKVADLFLRLRRTKDAEIAATVHFAAKELCALRSKVGHGHEVTELDVFDEVKRWKVKRHPPLKDDQVAATIRYLNILNWLSVSASEGLPLSTAEEMFA